MEDEDGESMRKWGTRMASPLGTGAGVHRQEDEDGESMRKWGMRTVSP